MPFTVRTSTLLFLVLLGCSTDELSPDNGSSDHTGTADDTSTPDDTGTADDTHADDGGEECALDDECAESIEADLQRLSEPREVEPYVASLCVSAYTSEDPCEGSGWGPSGGIPACLCLFNADEMVGDLLSDPAPPCIVYGKGADCLFGPDEFDGCDLDQADTSCEALCDEVDRRRHEDAQAELDTEVRFARCSQGHCEQVFRVGDRCLTAKSLAYRHSYDCDLTDEEILEADRNPDYLCN